MCLPGQSLRVEPGKGFVVFLQQGVGKDADLRFRGGGARNERAMGGVRVISSGSPASPKPMKSPARDKIEV